MKALGVFLHCCLSFRIKWTMQCFKHRPERWLITHKHLCCFIRLLGIPHLIFAGFGGRFKPVKCNVMQMLCWDSVKPCEPYVPHSQKDAGGLFSTRRLCWNNKYGSMAPFTCWVMLTLPRTQGGRQEPSSKWATLLRWPGNSWSVFVTICPP